MAKNHADQATFRERLLKLLKEGGWASIPGETHEELAHRLGVIPEVLDQVLREKRAGKSKAESEYAVVQVTMPPRVHKHWRAMCTAYRLSPAAVLRSLIHHFLLSGRRPSKIGSAWVYDGERFTIGIAGRHHAKARITRGAQVALAHYAYQWNVTPTGIARGLITEMLEARDLPKGIRVLAFSALSADAARDAARYLEAARAAR